MDSKTLEAYCLKAKDTGIVESNLIENEHGFMTWAKQGDTFVALNVYGNGDYWNNYMNQLAKDLGLSKIMVTTKRSPKAFVRKYNFNLSGYILEKGVV